MSDFEDDVMDVDDIPTKDTSIQFSSDNAAAKGKRIVSDLPVEAADNLPWSKTRLILFQGSKTLMPGVGLRNTDQTPWMMSPATRTFSRL